MAPIITVYIRILGFRTSEMRGTKDEEMRRRGVRGVMTEGHRQVTWCVARREVVLKSKREGAKGELGRGGWLIVS